MTICGVSITQAAAVSVEPSGSSIGLDDFMLLRVIGRGSYAKVFVVEQKSTKRVYAMKVIKKELVNDDEVTCCFTSLHCFSGGSRIF